MKKEIAQLLRERKPLPKGTRIVSRMGYMPIGGTHELDDNVLAAANRVPNSQSNTEPFWIYGWRDWHDDLSIPANDQTRTSAPMKNTPKTYDQIVIDRVQETMKSVQVANSHCCLSPGSTEFFHSGDKEKDVAALLDMAIDLVEIWNVKNSPYNQRLKQCWMKRAKELGATLSW